MQTSFPNPKSQIPNPKSCKPQSDLERTLTTKISLMENFHGQNELRKTRFRSCGQNIFKSRLLLQSLVIFTGFLGFGIWDLGNELHNPSNGKADYDMHNSEKGDWVVRELLAPTQSNFLPRSCNRNNPRRDINFNQTSLKSRC